MSSPSILMAPFGQMEVQGLQGISWEQWKTTSKQAIDQVSTEMTTGLNSWMEGHERFGATSEVRRFIGDSYSPLYQAGYLLGGKQLLALHDEMVGDGKLAERQFNDAVLATAPIPIELLRAELRPLPLTRDSRPVWSFAK